MSRVKNLTYFSSAGVVEWLNMRRGEESCFSFLIASMRLPYYLSFDSVFGAFIWPWAGSMQQHGKTDSWCLRLPHESDRPSILASFGSKPLSSISSESHLEGEIGWRSAPGIELGANDAVGRHPSPRRCWVLECRRRIRATGGVQTPPGGTSLHWSTPAKSLQNSYIALHACPSLAKLLGFQGHVLAV